jgi:hypothetical protein
MTQRIVTTAYRYKPPPRKRKAVPLAGPAVVTKRAQLPKAAPDAVTRRDRVAAPPPANDDRKAATSSHDATKSAIVTTAGQKQAKLDRARRQDDRPEDPGASAAMRAWLERAMRGRGPAG